MQPTDALSLDDLRSILVGSAGVSQGVDLGGNFADTAFADLGYDSVAVLELAAQLTSRYGVAIDDDALFDARTPGALLKLVNIGRPTAAD